MQRKILRYSLFVLALAFIGYHSVYFQKLDERTTAKGKTKFDAPSFARNFYDKNLLPSLGEAVDLSELLKLLQSNPRSAFDTYSHALNMGNIRYFLVQGEGTITSIEDDEMQLRLSNDSTGQRVTLATEFVYGNAIRDGSGQMNLNQFESTADFNSVSEEINRIVREEVLPPFRKAAKPGSLVSFSGAVELNQSHLRLSKIEVIPIRLEIKQ